MSWRTPLRKIVNSEDHLGGVRRGLMRVIDPIEWYMRKSDDDRTAHAPLQPDSAAGEEVLVINATPRDRTADDPAEDMDEFRRRRHSVMQEHRAFFEEKARDLLEGRDAFIQTTQGSVSARLVRFRNGAVFEHWETSTHSTGHGMSRIERADSSEPVEVLVSHLVSTAIDLE